MPGQAGKSGEPGQNVERVYRYHDGTKHHFHRFAQSLGYLDWASQPHPFRSFAGAPAFDLIPAATASASGHALSEVTYDQLFAGPTVTAATVTPASIGTFLRHALGLSAWKTFRTSRWSLRVNPSSGNLHPTEAYVLTGPLPGLSDTGNVWHYAPDRHALEQRCAFTGESWRLATSELPSSGFFVALTSIHWRESWKYGERAFRYCQHDLGHAVAALRLSAARCGWRVRILSSWPQHSIATLAGLDRDADYVDAEREEPECLLFVTASDPARFPLVNDEFVTAVRRGYWAGRASQLSADHVEWTFIDAVARATEDYGHADPEPAHQPDVRSNAERHADDHHLPDRGIAAHTLIRQRRSAVALDGISSIDAATFLRLLSRVLPRQSAPWDALWWSPRIHLILFVHRVTGVPPGLYALPRATDAVSDLTRAFHPEFAWKPAGGEVPLWLLKLGDYRAISKRVSCDQDIAADGFFSLAMLAEFDRSLEEQGPSFYRHLFWESGVVGQVLYLEAEAAGARATGIGCFFDDAVHQLLGLDGHVFQSLYHFTVGMPVEDARLTTEPGYPWDQNLA